MRGDIKVDLDYFDPKWIVLKTSANEAKKVGDKLFFIPDKECKKGHIHPRYASSLSCRKCDLIHKRELAKANKKNNKKEKKIKPLGNSCNPVRIKTTLTEEGDDRHMECMYYMDCSMHSMLGFLGPGKSWKCSPECIHNKMKKKRIR